MLYFLEKNGKIAEALGAPSPNPRWPPAVGAPPPDPQVVTPVICTNNFKSTTYYLILE